MHATLTAHVVRCRDGDNGFKVSWSLRMLTWVQCMQSLLKAMNRDLQGLWIARLARDPLLVSGLLLPVWCVGARTRFLMTCCTIPTFVNVFAGNLFIRLIYAYALLSSLATISHIYISAGWLDCYAATLFKVVIIYFPIFTSLIHPYVHLVHGDPTTTHSNPCLCMTAKQVSSDCSAQIIEHKSQCLR